jgi:hypothetical protein
MDTPTHRQEAERLLGLIHHHDPTHLTSEEAVATAALAHAALALQDTLLYGFDAIPSAFGRWRIRPAR